MLDTLRHPHSRRRLLAAAIAATAALPMIGCSGSTRAHAVDPSRAREALRTALDHWKSGQNPRSLASSPTPMTVQDFDWSGGARLVDYQIVDDGQPRDDNLSVKVKLVLDGAGKRPGKPVEKSVWYLVGTSPSVTVFRDTFHR